MQVSQQILSDITVFTKYARFIPELGRRETWDEIVTRNKLMHQRKYPQLFNEIEEAYQLVYDKKVLPSMRSLQFGGRSIELNNSRIYNCAFCPVDSIEVFSEAMFLLLGGTGVGYSVQRHDVRCLPTVVGCSPAGDKRFVVGDSIEGWADAVKVLLEAYTQTKRKPRFDYSDIRPKGATLVTSGGKAPGPEPLRNCINKLEAILIGAIGRKLTTLECHDMMCHIADAVLAGGIRRAALISLFSLKDESMLTCKSGNWWEDNPQRGRANNSAVILRHAVKKSDFLALWNKIEASGCGEPGFVFSNDKSWGTNPSLRAGTKVFTTDGIIPIEELQDKTFQVRNLNGDISDARCWLSGNNKRLYRIKLQGGHEYYCTQEHEWPVFNGESFTKKTTDQLETKDLLPILKTKSLVDGEIGDYDDGFFVGWHLGDGWSTKRADTGETQNGLCVFEKDTGIVEKLTSYLHDVLGLKCNFSKRDACWEVNSTGRSWSKSMEKFGYSHKSNGLPTSIWGDCSEEFRRGVVDGLFSTDAHVQKGDPRITLSSAHEKLIKEVSELLGFYGVKTSIKKRTTRLEGRDKEYPSYQLTIGSQASLTHFRNVFKLSVERKQSVLDSYAWKQPLKEEMWPIESIDLTDVQEDVWDISVYDDTHSFQIAHVITGNCAEIGLRPYQFCNLCEVNTSDVKDQADLNERCRVAAFIGTLQAGYTDFHYLRDIWQDTTEKDALIGVGQTGIASNKCKNLNLREAADIVLQENDKISKIIGINQAARTTTVKPSGTASIVLGCSSGIHAWHSDKYVRRMRFGKNESIYNYISKNFPHLVEDEHFRPDQQAVLSVPQNAPEGAICRTESVFDLLERVNRWNKEWVAPGHRDGQNSHNVSATISIKDDEWEAVGEWMWYNRSNYTGLSVLPYDGGTYIQAPFEDISEELFLEMSKNLHEIDLTQVHELTDNTNLSGEVACSGGKCDIV